VSSGRREKHAYPFEWWSSECPICADGYEGHEHEILGVAPAPAKDLVEAVGAGDWEAVRKLGFSGAKMRREDVVFVHLYRCPRSGRCAVFVSLDHLGRPVEDLVFQQILSEDSARQACGLVERWLPVLMDDRDRANLVSPVGLGDIFAGLRDELQSLWHRVRGRR
jgi:hypothetical protein